MKKRGLYIGIVIVAAVVLMFAFSAGKKDSGKAVYDNSAARMKDGIVECESPYSESYGYAADEPVDYAYMEEAAEYSSDSVAAKAQGMASSSAVLMDTSRKLIRTVNLTAETTEYDVVVANIRNKVNELGGYFESMNENVNNWGSGLRNMSLTIRVPKEKADLLIDDVTVSANVTQRSEDIEDVTLNYVDMQSHKKSLQAEMDRLNALMEKAETVEDLVTLEEKIADVRYRIESMESQLRTYDNQIDYTTVYLNINEVEKVKKPEPKGYWERIFDGIGRSFEGVVEDIADSFADVLVMIPYFIMWIIVILVVTAIVRRVFAKKKSKKISENDEEKNKE